MNITAAKTIYGEEIFFKFIEADYHSPDLDPYLIHKIHKGELDGVVNRGVFSRAEVDKILKNMSLIPEDEKLNTYVGQSFPHDFGTVSNSEERMDNYIHRVKKFRSLPFDIITDRLKQFFNRIGQPYQSGVPHFHERGTETAPGNFRILMPEKGGLFVHCGYLLQTSAPHYYNSINEMTREGQLSYFIMLQYPDRGGELTIYDLLWKDVNKKDVFEQNEYLIDANGERILLKDVRQFKVRPEPGDILVFSGGPIWHRVEDIKGARPRITFGGFINFSPDEKRFYHWS